MNYKLAETPFSLTTIYPRTQKMLADYATNEPPETEIIIYEEDIRAERERSAQPHSDPYLETLAVYRRLCDYLLGKDILLFHASAVAVDGEAYLFTAKSGTGKSTHARLWRELLGERAVMVNDDKPLLKIGEEAVTVYGTPWDGKHRLSRNMAVPARAICLLERGETNEISPIGPREALPALLRQAYRADAMERILPLVTRLADAVPLYRLRCNMEPEAAAVAWRGMHG